MPASKLTLSRFRIIDACFTSRLKKYWTVDDILQKLEEHDIFISRRTLESDFESLRYDERLGYLAPIQYCKRNKGYYYTEASYSLTNNEISTEDVDTLFVVRDFIKAFENIPLLKRFRGLLVRLASPKNTTDVEERSCVRTEKHFDDERAEVVSALFTAVRERIVVKIFMRGGEAGKRHSFFFHPYYLYRSHHSAFLAIGLIEDEPGYASLDINEIDSVLESSKTIIPYDAEIDKKTCIAMLTSLPQNP